MTKHALQHKALLDEKLIIETEKERYRSHLEAVFHSVGDGIVAVDSAPLTVIEANMGGASAVSRPKARNGTKGSPMLQKVHEGP